METMALQRTMEQAYTLLLRGAMAMVRHPYDAEDAVQSACCKAWMHQRELRSEQSCLPWLRKIVYHECLSILRERSRLVGLTPYDDLAADSAADFEQVVIVRGAISTLAEPYAIPLRMKYYEGQTIAEISRRLGLPSGTVKSRMHHGKQLLAKELAEGADDGRYSSGSKEKANLFTC